MTVKTKDVDASFQNQKVSLKSKRKDEWKVPNTNYIIYKALHSDGQAKHLTALFQRAAKGIVDKDVYDYVMKGLSTKKGQDKDKDVDSLYKSSRQIDFIAPIRDRYVGEFIRGFHKYNVVNHDPSFSDTIKEVLDSEFEDYIVQLFINNVNEISQQEQQMAQQSAQSGEEMQDITPVETGIDSAELPNIKIFMNEKRKEVIDKLTIKTNNLVEFVLDEVDAIDNYRRAFTHWFDCEEVVTHKEVIDNKTILNVINPIEYYRVDSGNRFVEDDKMGVRHYKMSIDDAIVKLNLSKSEQKYLRDLVTFRESYLNSDTNYREVDISDKVRESFGKSGYFIAYEPDSASYNGISKESFYDDSRLVDIYHVVWKGKTKYQILTYLDEFGEMQEIDVTEDYKLDPAKGDIELQTAYKDEAYENYRVGNDIRLALYTDPKPVDVQHKSSRGLNKVKLPYNGIRGSITNDYRNPIPYRIIPYMALYRIFTLQEERLISKLINLAGIFPIGESLLTPSKHFSLHDRISRTKKDGLFPYNDTQESSMTSIQNMGVNNSGSGAYNLLQSLMELRSQVKSEAWEVGNMNEYRFGDIDKYAGKSNTNEAIRRVSMGSVLMFESFNIFREREYNGLVHYGKYAHMDGIEEVFIDNQNKKQSVSYNPFEILNEDIGVKIVMNHVEQEKLEMFKEFAFNMSQNGKYSVAAKAISSDSSTEISNYIEQAEKIEQEMAQEEQRLSREHEKYISDMEAENKEKDRQNKLDDTSLQGEYDLIEKLIELDQDALKQTEESDDEDDNNLKERELELKERIQRYQEIRDNIDATLKNKQIDTQERIAKMNKN